MKYFKRKKKKIVTFPRCFFQFGCKELASFIPDINGAASTAATTTSSAGCPWSLSPKKKYQVFVCFFWPPFICRFKTLLFWRRRDVGGSNASLSCFDGRISCFLQEFVGSLKIEKYWAINVWVSLTHTHKTPYTPTHPHMPPTHTHPHPPTYSNPCKKHIGHRIKLIDTDLVILYKPQLSFYKIISALLP